METALLNPGSTIRASFPTYNSSGGNQVADVAPTGYIKRNGVKDVAVTITVTQDGTTNQYFATGTIPTTYAVPDLVELWIQARVGGITADFIIKSVDLVGFNATHAMLAPIAGAVSDGSPGANSFITNLTATDFYTGKILMFTSGTNAGGSMLVTGYNTTSKLITLLGLGFTTPPANNDQFVLLPGGKQDRLLLALLGGTSSVNVGTGAVTWYDTDGITQLITITPGTIAGQRTTVAFH